MSSKDEEEASLLALPQTSRTQFLLLLSTFDFCTKADITREGPSAERPCSSWHRMQVKRVSDGVGGDLSGPSATAGLSSSPGILTSAAAPGFEQVLSFLCRSASVSLAMSAAFVLMNLFCADFIWAISLALLAAAAAFFSLALAASTSSGVTEEEDADAAAASSGEGDFHLLRIQVSNSL